MFEITVVGEYQESEFYHHRTNVPSFITLAHGHSKIFLLFNPCWMGTSLSTSSFPSFVPSRSCSSQWHSLGTLSSLPHHFAVLIQCLLVMGLSFSRLSCKTSDRVSHASRHFVLKTSWDRLFKKHLIWCMTFAILTQRRSEQKPCPNPVCQCYLHSPLPCNLNAASEMATNED
jgi:hypothetical protein